LYNVVVHIPVYGRWTQQGEPYTKVFAVENKLEYTCNTYTLDTYTCNKIYYASW